ncbi:sugar transferase [Haemophilus parahaemolyticus]|uniref:sugar transferase n=1 Tax=Haemophilus parahaemolyticus TaxID=735 RepID=UPI0028E9BD6B|nr:sugar transferase [Haemophilus parahaemolyticus]
MLYSYLSRAILIFADVVSILFSIILAIAFRQLLGMCFPSLPVIDFSYINFASVYVTLVIIFAYFGLYTKRYDFWYETKLIVKASFFSFLLLFAGLALGQNAEYYSRSTLFLIFFFVTFITPLSKLLMKSILFKVGFWRCKAKVISDNTEFKYEIFNDSYLGYVKSNDSQHSVLFIDSYDMSREKLDKIIENNIRNCREIIFSPILDGYDFSNSVIYNLFESRKNIFTLENELLKKKNRLLKFFMDYAIVLISSVFWLPIFLAIMLKIKLEDPKGNIFFVQKILGLNGREFKCYKFRSMLSDQSFMEKWLDEHPEERENYRVYHKYINDPRITKIGAFLRKTSLDELPQLLNVLKGEMSLVGPRPYMVEEKADIGKKSSMVLAVKPGITGLWQVSGRSDVDFSKRVKIDVWYMKNWSLWNDIVILIKTISIVLYRRGAY